MSTSTRFLRSPSTPAWTKRRSPAWRLGFTRSSWPYATFSSSTTNAGLLMVKSLTPSSGWTRLSTFVPTSVISETASFTTSVWRSVRFPSASTSIKRRTCPSSPAWTTRRSPNKRSPDGRSWRSKAWVSVSITNSGRAATVGATSFESVLPTWWLSAAGASFLFSFSFMSAKAAGVGVCEDNKASACAINSDWGSFLRTDSSKLPNSSLATW